MLITVQDDREPPPFREGLRAMTRENRPFRRRKVLKTIGGAVVAGGAITGMSGSAGAQRGSLYNLTFNSDDDVAEWTANEPGWQVDRTAPDEWERVTGPPHNNVVRKRIDGGGDTSRFSAFQGMKYLDAGGESWGTEIPRRLRTSGSVFIDPAWETNDEKRRTGLWYALGNEDGDWTWFEIMEYRSSAVTGDSPAFFRFGSENGYESAGAPTRLELPPNAKSGGWVDLSMITEPGSNETEVVWKVNGEPLVDTSFGNPFGDTDHFMDFFVNSVNFGMDREYFFDGFSAKTN